MDVRNTFELDMLAGALGLAPVSVIVQCIIDPNALSGDIVPTMYTTIPSILWQTWLAFGLIALGYFLNGIFRTRLVMRSSSLEYTAIQAFAFIGSLIGGMLLFNDTMTVIQVICLFLYLIGHGWYRTSVANSMQERLARYVDYFSNSSYCY